MTHQMKICCPVLGIDPKSNSGGGVYDREVLTALAKNGIEVDVLLPKNRQHPVAKGLKVFYAPVKHMFPSYIFNFFALKFLFSRYNSNKFDLLRVHNPYFVGVAAIIFKFFNKNVTVVASYLHLEDGNWRFWLIDKAIINRFDWIVTISNFSKNEIVSKFPDVSKKISVIYPGVLSKYKPSIKNPKLIKRYNLQGKFVCLFLGGLKPRKNPGFLIEVAKLLKNENVSFLICGSGPEEEKLKRMIRKNNLEDSVFLAGFVKEESKVDYYNLADVFVLPSLKEGFGMIVTEAGACGKPAIVSDRGSLTETVKNQRTGYVLALDENLWAKSILKLSKNRKLIEQMSKEAIKFAHKFTWEENARQHVQLFKKLLNTQ